MSEQLTDEMQGLTLQHQQQHRRRKRRDYHAYAALGAEEQTRAVTPPLVSPTGAFDPNAAASSAGIGYSGIPEQSQPQQQPQQFQQSQQSQQFQQSQQQFHQGQFQQPQPQHLQDESQTASLSVPVARLKADEYYADKQFRTFENVAPPLAGTQYEVVDQGNASPKFSLMTMYSIPATGELLKSTGMPLGMLLRPFAEVGERASSEGDETNVGNVGNLENDMGRGPVDDGDNTMDNATNNDAVRRSTRLPILATPRPLCPKASLQCQSLTSPTRPEFRGAGGAGLT